MSFYPRTSRLSKKQTFTWNYLSNFKSWYDYRSEPFYFNIDKKEYWSYETVIQGLKFDARELMLAVNMNMKYNIFVPMNYVFNMPSKKEYHEINTPYHTRSLLGKYFYDNIPVKRNPFSFIGFKDKKNSFFEFSYGVRKKFWYGLFDHKGASVLDINSTYFVSLFSSNMRWYNWTRYFRGPEWQSVVHTNFIPLVHENFKCLNFSIGSFDTNSEAPPKKDSLYMSYFENLKLWGLYSLKNISNNIFNNDVFDKNKSKFNLFLLKTFNKVHRSLFLSKVRYIFLLFFLFSFDIFYKKIYLLLFFYKMNIYNLNILKFRYFSKYLNIKIFKFVNIKYLNNFKALLSIVFTNKLHNNINNLNSNLNKNLLGVEYIGNKFFLRSRVLKLLKNNNYIKFLKLSKHVGFLKKFKKKIKRYNHFIKKIYKDFFDNRLLKFRKYTSHFLYCFKDFHGLDKLNRIALNYWIYKHLNNLEFNKFSFLLHGKIDFSLYNINLKPSISTYIYKKVPERTNKEYHLNPFVSYNYNKPGVINNMMDLSFFMAPEKVVRCMDYDLGVLNNWEMKFLPYINLVINDLFFLCFNLIKKTFGFFYDFSNNAHNIYVMDLKKMLLKFLTFFKTIKYNLKKRSRTFKFINGNWKFIDYSYLSYNSLINNLKVKKRSFTYNPQYLVKKTICRGESQRQWLKEYINKLNKSDSFNRVNKDLDLLKKQLVKLNTVRAINKKEEKENELLLNRLNNVIKIKLSKRNKTNNELSKRKLKINKIGKKIDKKKVNKIINDKKISIIELNKIGKEISKRNLELNKTDKELKKRKVILDKRFLKIKKIKIEFDKKLKLYISDKKFYKNNFKKLKRFTNKKNKDINYEKLDRWNKKKVYTTITIKKPLYPYFHVKRYFDYPFTLLTPICRKSLYKNYID